MVKFQLMDNRSSTPPDKNLPRKMGLILPLVFLLLLLPFGQGCINVKQHSSDHGSGTNSDTGPKDGRAISTSKTVTKELEETKREKTKISSLGPSNIVESVPKDRSKSEPVTEVIKGYKLHTEYFMVSSEYQEAPVAAVSLPDDYYDHPDKRYPLVLVFGGAGECARPPRQGALAWVDYYSTDEAVIALHSGKLTASDFKDLAKGREIDYFNKVLKKNPYNGIILVCPASPLLTTATGVESPGYEKYIMEELLPALKEHYRVDGKSIGVDGVSMGGARSMYYGFKYPGTFMSIGSVQAAVGPFMDIYGELLTKNRSTLKDRSIQLVTSDKDPMAGSVKRLAALLKKNGIQYRYLNLTGPHDYIFNQGPGAISLLIFHDRSLWALKSGPTN